MAVAGANDEGGIGVLIAHIRDFANGIRDQYVLACDLADIEMEDYARSIVALDKFPRRRRMLAGGHDCGSSFVRSPDIALTRSPVSSSIQKLSGSTGSG